jgi:hypothetical protein
MDSDQEQSDFDYGLLRAASPPEVTTSPFPPPPRIRTTIEHTFSSFSGVLSGAATHHSDVASRLSETFRQESESAAEPSSSSSSSSSAVSDTSDVLTIHDDGPFRIKHTQTYSRILREETFVVQVLSDDDTDDDEDIETIFAIYEDADTDDDHDTFGHRRNFSSELPGRRGSFVGIFSSLSTRDRDSGSHDMSEQERRYRNKKKRWSSGYKRSYSQSVGSDSDTEEGHLEPNEMGASAGRFKRRLSNRGHQQRSSLVLDGMLPLVNVTEVDEEDVSEEAEFIFSEFPLWAVSTSMVFDSDTEL